MSPGDAFVDALSTMALEHVFNPYSTVCPLHDRADAPARRRRNLQRSLDVAIKHRVRTIWIARDLGYRGGRRTGLALTDEIHLQCYSALFHGLPVEKATKGPPMSERTASVIWQMLRRFAEPVFLWNVFPLHPHEPDNPMSNRCHSIRERKFCENFLEELLELLLPDTVLAIGGDAHRAVEELGIDCIRVRHPSYGGQTTFTAQIESIYGLSPTRNRNLFTQHA